MRAVRCRELLLFKLDQASDRVPSSVVVHPSVRRMKEDATHRLTRLIDYIGSSCNLERNLSGGRGDVTEC